VTINGRIVRAHGLVTAKIRCFNRSTNDFFDRYYFADLGKYTEAEQHRFQTVLARSVNHQSFPGIRDLMRETPEGALPSRIDGPSHHFFVPDYFEDETGEPIDPIEIAKHLTGEEFPVTFDVRSVLKLGPTAIERKHLWTQETANEFAHFFQLIEVISTGAWITSPVQLSGHANSINDDRLLNVTGFNCPPLSEMFAVLLPIRQLYSSDEVFNRVCKLYLRHTSDQRKRTWVTWNKKCFNDYLESSRWVPSVGIKNVRHLLDTVMYGAGLVHYSKTPPNTRQEFRDLIARGSREQIIFDFVTSCHFLYGYANHAFFVFRQDFDHWIQEEGCARPDVVCVHELFRSGI